MKDDPFVCIQRVLAPIVGWDRACVLTDQVMLALDANDFIISKDATPDTPLPHLQKIAPA